MKNKFTGTFLLIAASLLSVYSCKREQPKPEFKTYSISEFLSTVNFRGASFSSDQSKILVSNDKSGIYNAYYIPVAGGDPVPLTASKTDAVFALSYFPDDDRVLLYSDKGGNELSHLYVRELDSTLRDITPGENLKAEFLGFAQDNRSFFVAHNQRDARYFDVYELDVKTYQPKMIFKNTEGLDVAAVSPDKRFLALMKSESTSDHNIFLFDTKTQSLKNLTPHEGDVANFPQTFSPDGKDLYYLTNENDEFLYLVKQNLETGAKKVVEKTKWDVEYAYFSKKGKYLVIGINNDARTELKIFETATMLQTMLPKIENAEIKSVVFSADESKIAFYASGGKNPNDLFIFNLAGGNPKQLTRSLSPAINSADLVDAQVVRFSSFDSTQIPGILYKPVNASDTAKVPALVWVHGGPGGQSRTGYSALIQYLVNHGYAVYAINNRGSSGYGKTFFKADDRDHGNGDLKDCVESKKMLAATGWIDPDKIGIIGGSYGGFMVLAALTFQPQEFAVGVNLFGVSNWVRTLANSPAYWESFKKALEIEMGSLKDETYLKSISPLFHADKIEKPLMVLQGANDPRVLKVESDEIVAEARKNGVPVEYLVFPDEGHGFIKKENQEKGYEAILKFLDLHLKGK
ncbi:MAG: S9 family peptidase [Bacteroidetes bacterium]|nr:S9 family peptidase [Bacteroidota bacterium]